MAENKGKAESTGAKRLADVYQESLEKPELRQGLINNLSAALDSDEKIEAFAKRLGDDPEELKKLLKKPR
jgi:hypothetical protein